MARGAADRTRRCARSGPSRHWVSTWIVTSSGIRSSSISWRTKSKSGWLADGNPTSISLKPIATSVSNMRRLRSGSIGSMSAWLPSRRSTAHHCGALVSWLSGQVRSGSSSGTNGWYFSNGIVFGVAGCGGISGLASRVLGSVWCAERAVRVPGASLIVRVGRTVARKRRKLPAFRRRAEARAAVRRARAYISRRRWEVGRIPTSMRPAAPAWQP